MQVGITVENVAKESRTYNEKTIWGVKFKGDWYNLYTPVKPVIGSFIPCEVTETHGTYKGKPTIYRDAIPNPGMQAHHNVNPIPPQNGSQQAQKQEAIPTPQPTYRLTFEQVQAAYMAVVRDLVDWRESPRGFEATAMIAQSVILGMRQGEIAPPIPDEHEQPVNDGKGEPWERG
jgi:hypothetical protein